jgi:hypothetical protein
MIPNRVGMSGVRGPANCARRSLDGFNFRAFKPETITSSGHTVGADLRMGGALGDLKVVFVTERYPSTRVPVRGQVWQGQVPKLIAEGVLDEAQREQVAAAVKEYMPTVRNPGLYGLYSAFIASIRTTDQT